MKSPGVIGRTPALPPAIEEKLVETTKKAASMGFGLSKKQLLIKTGKVVKNLKLKTPFKKGIPGKDWYIGLQGRHPELALKRPQKLSVTRAKAMNREATKEYFDILKGKLDELNVQPEFIWNCDETNIQLEHKPRAVIGRKGSNVPGRVASSKESVSILGCGNAMGRVMSPMVIVKGKTKTSLMGWKTEDAPRNTKWAFQSKSYMDKSLGVDWFQNVFLQECGPQRPQLLIVDSHCSHEPLDLLELARKENITMLSLPSHCTHYLQPWDRSMFSPLKNKYNTVCSEFMAENVCHNITKQTWPGLFCKAWTSAITAENMKSGFHATGIYPFNPNIIPAEAYMTSPETVENAAVETVVDENNEGQTPVEVQQLDNSQAAVDSNVEIIYSQTFDVVADIHLPPRGALPESNITLDFPVLVDGNVQNLPMPVVFQDEGLQENETPDLGNVSLTEVSSEELPSEVWNSDLDAILLPQSNKVAQVSKNKNASNSRILTSDEIIQAKKEKEVLKEQKAKAAEERKIRAAERKKNAPILVRFNVLIFI